MLFHERLDFHVVVELHAGFQNDPTSSYLRAPSCFSGGGARLKKKKVVEIFRGGHPQSVQVSLNGPCLIRHRRLILKNPERDKPFPGQACRATPDLRGRYEPLWTEQIEQPLFFSLADNWIRGYAWPTNGRLTFRLSAAPSIIEGPAIYTCWINISW